MKRLILSCLQKCISFLNFDFGDYVGGGFGSSAQQPLPLISVPDAMITFPLYKCFVLQICYYYYYHYYFIKFFSMFISITLA
jgi:hypothetical protein